MVLRVSSNRWSRKESDIDPEKSSIGEISSKISSRPERSGTSVRPEALAAATRACHRSLPSNQSKLSVCRANRSGTSRGSWIWAKLSRPEAVRAEVTFWDALREAANGGPSTGVLFVVDASPAPLLRTDMDRDVTDAHSSAQGRLGVRAWAAQSRSIPESGQGCPAESSPTACENLGERPGELIR